jgi:protein transport protein SEC24
MTDDGHDFYMWIHRRVNPDLLHAVFDVSSVEEINALMSSVPALETNLNVNLRMLIEDITIRDREHSRRFQLARQGLDGAEHTVASLLEEDMNNENRSYVDFLVFLHKQIQQEV